MEYTIISAKTPITIEKHVNALMVQGWTPCGGIGFGKEFFVQAMTRDPLAKALQAQNTTVYNASNFGGNGTSEKP